MERKDVNILDYLAILYRARRYIVVNFIAVCTLAAIASVLLPPYYKSTATLLPPSEGGDSFGFSEVMSMLPVNIRLGSQGSPSDIYIGIMKSTTLVSSIVDQFDLVDVYGVPTKDDAINSLRGMTDISISKEGLIQIEMQDRDPERAAALANAYWILLDSLNQHVNRLASIERSSFLAQQIEDNGKALSAAEEELKLYQSASNAVSPLYQQRVALSIAAEIETNVIQKEALLKEYRMKGFSEHHALVRDLTDQVALLRTQLTELRSGADTQDAESLMLPLDDVSDVIITYTKLTRRVDLLNQLDQLLHQQYEEAMIQQANHTSTVTVLDHAIPPMKKFRPKRKLIVLVAAIASLFFSLITILLIEFINRLTEDNPEHRAKVRRLAQFLRIAT